ncbi:MAG TPA: undecaprenyldiphospho-muramoylpentapeptide beta-N-acetylglucosaminyltransferase [Acidisarcina sp.]|nr:undecaprenyldiphospho-muramoylpentapeptide beta-N-acetylglucosaminyltransferase [Acidisarcina sp.]
MAEGNEGLRVLIAGGGTGGHIIPALAIARELKDRFHAEVRFVGTSRGLETRLVPQAGYRLELIQVGQLKNVSLRTRLRTLLDLPLGLARCFALLREFRPHAVVGVGGYASGPAMMAAILSRVPTLAFEPNAAPGLANRLIGKWVNAAAVNFPPAAAWFRNAEVTGIPVRAEFFSIPRKGAGASPRLLVFGGSQGGRVLNQHMAAIAPQLLAALPTLTIMHQAGARHAAQTQADYAASGAPPERWQVQPFLEDMPDQFALADLILSRSGASTVAELAAAGRPALLVPFAAAADDHQRKNAEVLADAGAAVLLLEKDVTPEHLLAALLDLLRSPDRLLKMGERARSLAHPEAARRIAEKIDALAGKRAKS